QADEAAYPRGRSPNWWMNQPIAQATPFITERAEEAPAATSPDANLIVADAAADRIAAIAKEPVTQPTSSRESEDPSPKEVKSAIALVSGTEKTSSKESKMDAQVSPDQRPKKVPVATSFTAEQKETKAQSEDGKDGHVGSKEEISVTADGLFNDGKYSQALQAYSRQMASGEPAIRENAALGAARCFLALGQKANAKKLLQTLAETGSGAEKRTAKRMLKDLEDESGSE
ncbi:MAG: tetratricopeptide repeat protein, partial [Sphingobacteriales bacterium]